MNPFETAWRLTPDLKLLDTETGFSVPVHTFVTNPDCVLPLLAACRLMNYDNSFDFLSLARRWAEYRERSARFSVGFDFRWHSDYWFKVCLSVLEEDTLYAEYGCSHAYLLWTRETIWGADQICELTQDLPIPHERRDTLIQCLADREQEFRLELLDWDAIAELICPSEYELPAMARSAGQQTPCRARRPIKKRVRFEVLHRCDFTCQACGAKAADGAELHIDHIHPVSKGGTNDPANLQALCRDCNLGKGARVL
jgi:hypothetical protein